MKGNSEDYKSSMELRKLGLLNPPSVTSFKPGDYRNSVEFDRLIHGYEPKYASIFKAPDNHKTLNGFR